MEQHRYKIENKVFYLDVKNAPKLESQAIIYIRKYGGIVSTFLDSKVNYILHNGHLQQTKAVEKTSIQPIGSTTPKKAPFALSRSQRLLAASVKTTPQTPKPNESQQKMLQCKNLDIRDFLQFFKRISDEETRVAKEFAKATDPNNRRLRKLKGRFVKVAFNCGRFRTMFKEFIYWPELDIEFDKGELCPFASTQNLQKTSVLNSKVLQGALQELQKTSQFPHLTPGTPSGQVDASNSLSATPNTTPLSTAFASKLTTPFGHHSIRTLSRSKRSINAQKRPGIYCEICSSDFDDYEQHINDIKHVQCLKNSENYQELVNLVQTLPNNYDMPDNNSDTSTLLKTSSSPTSTLPSISLSSLSTATTFTFLSKTSNHSAHSIKITVSPREEDISKKRCLTNETMFIPIEHNKKFKIKFAEDEGCQ